MPAHIRAVENDMEDFENSDSEEDYNETEKDLLEKVRNRKKEFSDSEDEVYNVGSNDDEDDDDDDDDDDDEDGGNKSDLAVSDVEGQESDDGLPDIRAWGKEKKKYYSTDYVDPDYGGFQGKDAYLAELEEEEARNLQKQLAQQLDDDDFSLGVFTEKSKEDKVLEEVIKTDISKLSKRQKLQILQKESPEFFRLVEDFQEKMLIIKDYVSPVLTKYKANQIPSCKAVDFVQTQYELIMNYCVNIYMYLLLKASKVNVQNHPIIKRLYQYRQLLFQLEPVFKDIIKPQIEIILKELQEEDDKVDKKKTLKLLACLMKKEEPNRKKKHVAFEEDKPPIKKIKVSDNSVENGEEKMEIDPDGQSSSGEEKEEGTAGEQIEEEGAERRAITYKMSKNKGLTPHRKKEQRNPRVKHKLKYRKALIRRKGAVREPRRELTRYSGEISGIKASVSKSIKIKT